MKTKHLLKAVFATMVIFHQCSTALLAKENQESENQKAWRGVHVFMNSPQVTEQLINTIGKLHEMGVNVLIAEVDYWYEYKSHPELRETRITTKEQVKRLVAECRKHKIRLIPEFQCLGHQSWGSRNHPLLEKYPQFDESPGKYPGNKGIYCRSWCPLHPEVNKIIFELIDELINDFQADAFHVGMDEVFVIGDAGCPRCKGKNPATLFAKAVNDLHGHIVGKHKIEMLMWGDRLIDGKKYDFGECASSFNGTAPAIDLIPQNIVICDWHYTEMNKYLSVPMFLAKGFRVWPTSFRDVHAAKSLIDYSKQFNNDRMLGHLSTAWTIASPSELPQYESLRYAMYEFGGGMNYWKKNPLKDADTANAAFGSFKLIPKLNTIPDKEKIIGSVQPTALAGQIQKKSQDWKVRVLRPNETNQLLFLKFPAQTPSESGDSVEGEFSFNLSNYTKGEALSLLFFFADDLDKPNWPDYRFYQILLEDKIIWEKDMALTVSRQGNWEKINIPQELLENKKQLNIKWRTVDKQRVKNYPCNIYIGPIYLLESENISQKELISASSLKEAVKNKKGVSFSEQNGIGTIHIDGGGVHFKKLVQLEKKWKTLCLKMKMRTQNIENGDALWQDGRLIMRFLNDKKRMTGDWPRVFHATGTTPWKQCERDYEIPADASYLELDFGNFGKKGSIDFSNINLSVAEFH